MLKKFEFASVYNEIMDSTGKASSRKATGVSHKFVQKVVDPATVARNHARGICKKSLTRQGTHQRTHQGHQQTNHQRLRNHPAKWNKPSAYAGAPPRWLQPSAYAGAYSGSFNRHAPDQLRQQDSQDVANSSTRAGGSSDDFDAGSMLANLGGQ
jgi:hypothetical protein